MVKKIAIIYSGARYFGGVETYLLNLFKAADSTKVELTLVSLGNWELTKKLEAEKFSTLVFDNKWWNLLSIFKISRKLKINKYDLIVSQGMVSNFYGRMIALFSGIASLVTVHSDYKFDYPNWKKYIYYLTFRPLNFLTRKYIVVSEFLKEELIRLGISDSKITVIYNGIEDIGSLKKPEREKVVLGSLGRLHYKKGYANLIKAMSILKNKDLELRIWGDGEEKESLTKLIGELKLEDSVRLMGFTNDIKSALSEINVYVQPSLEEGFGLTVADAMLAEKPVIVTPAGSLPELITDGKTGFITKDFEPESIAETLEKVIVLKNLKDFGLAARSEALKRFSIREWSEKTIETYAEVAK